MSSEDKIPIVDAVALDPPQTIAAPAKLAIAAPTPAPATASVNRIPPIKDLGREPVQLKCQYCNHEGITKTSDQFGTGTWVWSVGCFCFLFWPCAFLPLCNRSLLMTEHRCENCNRVVGTQEPFT